MFYSKKNSAKKFSVPPFNLAYEERLKFQRFQWSNHSCCHTGPTPLPTCCSVVGPLINLTARRGINLIEKTLHNLRSNCNSFLAGQRTVDSARQASHGNPASLKNQVSLLFISNTDTNIRGTT